MEEENPLQICLPSRSGSVVNNNSNRRGRPKKNKTIVFGPQPKSIIAQLLSENKTKNVVDSKNETIICLEDGDLSDEYQENKLQSNEDQICSICSHRSNNAAEHTKHIQIKHKQYSCDYPNCKYSCKLSSNLVKHKRVHTNEKPFLCEKCSFRSNFVNSLKVHKRIHTAERPFQCNHCSYKCNSSSNLKKHCRHRHPDILECKCIIEP